MPNQLQNRAANYVGLLEQDIQSVQAVLGQTQTLVESNDPQTLHEAAQKLIHVQLATQWVQVPRQYSHADYYLMAMDRFLQLGGISGYSILLPVERETITMVMTDLNVPAAFAFEPNHDQNGGAYFVELTTGERLFYWSLERKQILFNAKGIVNLLVANFANHNVTADQSRVIANLLTEFGRYMERVFGYAVDFNLLETRDDYIYNLIQHAEPQGMLDKLFVLSADTHFFLQSMQNGAAIALNDNTEVRVFYVNDANALGAQRWHFQVVDGRDQYSWLDILLNYNFIAQWYLSETTVLEIAYDQLVFAIQKSTPQDVQPIFTAEQGTKPMLTSEIAEAKAQAAANEKALQEKAAAEAKAQAAQKQAEVEAQTDTAAEIPDNAVTVEAETTIADGGEATTTSVNDTDESKKAENGVNQESAGEKSFEEEIGEAVNGGSKDADA